MQNKNEFEIIIQESGLESAKIKEYAEMLNIYAEKIPVWEDVSNAIIVADHTDIQSMETARKERLEIKKERVQAEKFIDDKRAKVQELMSAYKTEDQFLLDFKKLFTAKSKHYEAMLLLKEETKKRYDEELLRKQTEERIELLRKYTSDPESLKPESMTDEVFQLTITALEKKYVEAQEQERKRKEEAEAERIKSEKISKRNADISQFRYLLEDETILIDDMKDEEFEKYIDILKEKHSKYQSEQEEKRLENEKLKQKLENEKAEIEAERKKAEAIEKAKIKAEQDLLKAPDKIQLQKCIEEIAIRDISLKSKEAIEAYKEIKKEFILFKSKAMVLIENLK